MASASIYSVFSQHHKDGDDLLKAIESFVSKNDWSQIDKFHEFCENLLSHFHAEENVLFPALESKMGGPIGPTMVMRQEHEHARQILEKMKISFDKKDSDSFLSASKSLMLILQQHNIKEEQVLFPLCDRSLTSEISLILEKTSKLFKK